MKYLYNLKLLSISISSLYSNVGIKNLIAYAESLEHQNEILRNVIKHQRNTIRTIRNEPDEYLSVPEIKIPLSLELFCPECGMQHIDEGEWEHKVHRTHQCQNPECGHEWRPFEFHTFGVKL